MQEPTYRQAVVQAWHAVWHNKILWIFGLLSIFLGQFGFSDLFGKLWLITSGNGLSYVLPLFTLAWPQGAWGILGAVLVGIIFLCLLLMVVFLSVASQGALISYSSEWFKDKKYSNILKSWHRSLKNFWRLLAVQVIRKFFLALVLLFFAFSLRGFISSNSLPVNILFAIVLVFLLFLSLFTSIMTIYTSCYAIVDNKGLWPAFKKAWELLKGHVFVSIEVGFVLMFMNFVLLVLIFFGTFAAFLPAVIVWIVAGFSGLAGLVVFGFGLGIFLWVILVVLLSACFNAFTTSAWVYLFSKMHHEGIASRVAHWLRHII